MDSHREIGRTKFRDRLLADAILLILVYTAPWWLTLTVGLVLLFYFDSYIEFVFGAFIMDSIFNTRSYFDIFYVASLGALLLYVVSEFLKRHLTLYSD